MNIGSLTVIARERFIIPEGKPAEFDINYNEITIHITVRFKSEAVTGTSSAVRWNQLATDMNINISIETLSTTPLVTRKPMQLGTFDDGRKLLLLAEYYRYADMGVISLQFMVGEVQDV